MIFGFLVVEVENAVVAAVDVLRCRFLAAVANRTGKRERASEMDRNQIDCLIKLVKSRELDIHK